MSPNPSWRIFTGLGSAVLFVALILWTTFQGSPSNALHVHAQGSSFVGLFTLIGLVLGSKGLEAVADRWKTGP